MRRRICIDPGHGGIDPGCRHNGIVEKRTNLAIARSVRSLLVNHDGCAVHMTRDSDDTVELRERVAAAHSADVDLFLSIHVNGNLREAPRGMWVIRSANAPDFTDQLAVMFDNTIRHNLAGLALPDNWVTQRHEEDEEVSGHSLYVLRHTRMPALLAECGFASNPLDAARLQSPEFVMRLAAALAAAAGACLEMFDA